MTPAEFDAFLRGELAGLEKRRPGTARLGSRERWDEARASFCAAVAGKTGVDAVLVADLLERRELAREPGHTSCWPAQRVLADSVFAASVMAAAAARGDQAVPAARGRGARDKGGRDG
jgi:hypothetical protein